MKLEDDKVIVINPDGTEKAFDYMFSLDHMGSGRTYVAFADNDTNDVNRDMYFGWYPTDEYAGELYPVDTDKERPILEKAMAMFEERIKGL